MKKTLTILLALCLLMACGGNSGNKSSNNDGASAYNQVNTPTKQARVINPSELITLKDAEQILGTNMKIRVDKKSGTEQLDVYESPGGIRTVYIEDAHGSSFMFQISIRQDAALNENKTADKKLISSGGISFYTASLKRGYENDKDGIWNAIWLEGIGDWACITCSVIYTINVAYGAYLLDVTISSRAKGTMRSTEKESEWKIEKLKEAGNFALKRLKTIIE